MIAEELAWFRDLDERLLGLVVRDLADNDFAFYVLGRDRLGRFRCVALEVSINSKSGAEAALESRLLELASQPDAFFYQEDEVGDPVDFFSAPAVVKPLHPNFQALSTGAGYSPAREIISAMMKYHRDADGNFVQQFQTEGTDSRLWELYLYATFVEHNYAFVREHPAPDFHCRGLLGEFFVEATTVNATSAGGVVSEPAPPEGGPERERFFNGYVPIKFGSALTSKFKKRYWERGHVAGKPLLLAVQDFRSPGSMSWSSTGLVEYLYATRQTAVRDADGMTALINEKILDHRWGHKVIASGFFSLPGSENISAVIANPSGTISKFNRMGYIAGFGARDIRMIRGGSAYQGGILPTQFTREVHSNDYVETWSEGLCVYHNPRARYPLEPQSLPNVAHFFFDNDQVVGKLPLFHPVSELTHILIPAR